MATTSMTSTPSLGVRSPLNTWEGVMISRQPPQSLEICSKRDFTQRSAAPMPCLSDLVSERVWRVPKLTSLVSVAWSSAGLMARAMSCSAGCSAGGGWGPAARAARLRRALGRINRARLAMGGSGGRGRGSRLFHTPRPMTCRAGDAGMQPQSYHRHPRHEEGYSVRLEIPFLSVILLYNSNTPLLDSG